MNPLSELEVFKWATKVAKDHPLIATLGVLGILIVFTYSMGRGSNADFPSTLLALVGISFALFHTFVPAPSMRRGVVALLLTVIWVSVLLNAPFRLQALINRALEPSAAVPNVSVSTLPATTASAPPIAASAPTIAPPPIASAAVTDTYESRQFSTSSGSINVGCGEGGSANATFSMPNGAILESASARWANTSNLSGANQSTAQTGSNVVATGTIRGLDFQNLAFGIRNCPGGGHGTLVLSGSYKVPVR